MRRANRNIRYEKNRLTVVRQKPILGHFKLIPSKCIFAHTNPPATNVSTIIVER